MLAHLLRVDEDIISKKMFQYKRKWKRVREEPNKRRFINCRGVRDFEDSSLR